MELYSLVVSSPGTLTQRVPGVGTRLSVVSTDNGQVTTDNEPCLILNVRVIRSLRRLARLLERADPLPCEQRDELQKHFAGHDRIPQRSMATDHVDAKPPGERLQAVLGLIGLGNLREQQRIQHRLCQCKASLRLLQLKEAQVEGRVVSDQHGVFDESDEQRQHL